MPRVRVNGSFKRALAKLGNARARDAVSKALEKFQRTPRHPSLRFKALKGRKDYYTARAGVRYRILFRREETEAGTVYAAVDVDLHDPIYRKLKRLGR